MFNDLRKSGVKRWRKKALNRDEWASIGSQGQNGRAIAL